MSSIVRIGVIGCGGMARHHMKNFAQIPDVRFAAAADIEPAKLESVVKEYGVEGFDDGHKLIKSGKVDAIVIATPHYFHPVFAIAGMKAGLHVLTEKPVAVTAKAAEEVNKEAAKHKKLVYAAMFNQRTNPAWKKVQEVVAGGQLGAIQRTTWIITNWFRTQAYYDSGGWRATWGGEGGGVLINQCPHNLDLFQWFVGMPRRVTATVGLGRYHKIEVEDDVTAMMEFESGATGVFITTTGEAPGTNRLEIAGDKGKIVSDGGPMIEMTLNDLGAREFSHTTRESFASPGRSKVTIEVGRSENEHLKVMKNFAAAILRGEPLIAPAQEGIRGLELGNAMLMSGILKKPVDLPTPREKFDQLIRKLARTSTFQKTVREAKADMSASFR